MADKCLVTGAGGFIGGHLVGRLLDEGFAVRAVDIKPVSQWWQVHDTVENMPCQDLRRISVCRQACTGVANIYNLAADMGGIGFIENNKCACMLNVLINTHLLMAAVARGVRHYLFTSSACVYAADKQSSTTLPPLVEPNAYPAMPEDGYGWEKLFSERMCRHFSEEYGLQVRVPRLHNVYGPHGSWNDGREKAPAAICRKVAEAVKSDCREILIWGDGTRTRSFMYIADCIEGLRRLMDSDFSSPVNLGSTEVVRVNQLVDKVESIAGTALDRFYDETKPKGVHGRNSDNTLLKTALNGWEPQTKLIDGLGPTYAWIKSKVDRSAAQ
jgi:GDP-D-mannose 3',5'-epimerase